MAQDHWRDFARDIGRRAGELANQVLNWWATKHHWPYDDEQLNRLKQLSEQIQRQSSQLTSELVTGIIIFMGGTGVGKSTLLNALAGQPIAPAGPQRPTTLNVMCYVHAQMPYESLPPPIREKVVRHHNDALRNKVLVDAPDIDSRIGENYQRLRQILPYADVILYIGSPEKYHDEAGWELFQEFSRHKAFAFVLNRWDECTQRERSGRRPDDDWLEDLRREGYTNPVFFRTAALLWAEKRTQALPPDEQFGKLRSWLEAELGEKELLAIQKTNLERSLRNLVECGNALIKSASISRHEVWQAWQDVLERETDQFIERFERFIDNKQERLNNFLRAESRQRIGGWLAWLIHRIPGVRTAGPDDAARDSRTYTSTYIADIVNDLADTLRHYYPPQYGEDLTNRLLAEANHHCVPPGVLESALQKIARRDWIGFWKDQVRSSIQESLESLWQPMGWRGQLRALVSWLPGRLCWLAGFAGVMMLIYRMFSATVLYSPGLGDVLYFLLPFFLAEAFSYWLNYYFSPRDWRTIASRSAGILRQRILEGFSEFRRILDQELDSVGKEVDLLRRLMEEAKDLVKSIDAKREEIEHVRRLYRA